MTDDEKTDGFKIAILMLTAFGSILYLVYKYCQSIAIEGINLYFLIFPIIFISILLIIAYIFIKEIK